MELTDFYVCETFFSVSGQKFTRDFHRVVKIFERTIGKWFQFLRKMNNIKYLIQNKRIQW